MPCETPPIGGGHCCYLLELVQRTVSALVSRHENTETLCSKGPLGHLMDYKGTSQEREHTVATAAKAS